MRIAEIARIVGRSEENIPRILNNRYAFPDIIEHDDRYITEDMRRFVPGADRNDNVCPNP